MRVAWWTGVPFVSCRLSEVWLFAYLSPLFISDCLCRNPEVSVRVCSSVLKPHEFKISVVVGKRYRSLDVSLIYMCSFYQIFSLMEWNWTHRYFYLNMCPKAYWTKVEKEAWNRWILFLIFENVGSECRIV